MAMNVIVRDAVGKGGHIRIVTVGQDAHPTRRQGLGEEIGRPVDTGEALLIMRIGGPGAVGVSVQPMYKDDVHLGVG